MPSRDACNPGGACRGISRKPQEKEIAVVAQTVRQALKNKNKKTHLRLEPVPLASSPPF